MRSIAEHDVKITLYLWPDPSYMPNIWCGGNGSGSVSGISYTRSFFICC